MRLNTTGIAARMMLSLDKKAIGEKLINGRQINPTPLQVRYPQGVREVLGIMSEQLAISTADLTRILLEDALHNMFMPADNTAGNIISRIEYIMLSHDINAPLLATLLSPWNIRSTVIQDPARLADYLSADALEHLAEYFNLNPDWLNGHENYPIALSGEWPDTADNFRMLINDSSNTEVIFWHSFPFAGNTKREYYGVILRQKKEINGSVIYPALSLSPTILNDEKRKWLTEYTTRQNTTISLRRVTLRPGLAGNLITGQILPVSLFNTSLLPW
ncbi:conjugal transfer protein TraE [Salmonella enterica subsp. enterica serovar Muenchen]|nr:conjugal transfer protein TraE [Salmonella enterica]EBC9896877.1 conjugal transfer protein TraE [Salmonella enterica subsp. enterica serovar Derby]EBS0186933.1 conjugal transfer protein TraE [Salmonella enterica subsp. enterica serovar Heidelberg]ECJ1129384.1 conjugal transfer protein TraE [Salmonella enterica subsp. enterica serovar Putten]ECT0705998.1 conjugal transfer protein TraE [Salmonella enterica subsp. enterica serovar Agona]ECU0503494.1 conjugal transfer protein TraE [Salmonella e